ncbi:6791_t:CDS:2 [Funneliformis geosporum]|nr:6791_t:CDS:2 [Funneliformis geosporum]
MLFRRISTLSSGHKPWLKFDPVKRRSTIKSGCNYPQKLILS